MWNAKITAWLYLRDIELFVNRIGKVYDFRNSGENEQQLCIQHPLAHYLNFCCGYEWLDPSSALWDQFCSFQAQATELIRDSLSSKSRSSNKVTVFALIRQIFRFDISALLKKAFLNCEKTLRIDFWSVITKPHNGASTVRNVARNIGLWHEVILCSSSKNSSKRVKGLKKH